ncbi:MAG TPA: alpha/beta hydrolase [Rhodocyclaceae bacterium]|nr:alpha/beta hydrolase [Rhodocyclaceae bacterium]
MKPSNSRFVEIRGLQCHVREWGTPGRPQLHLLHGWGDASATFQFLVDALRHDWHVLAPDWRGFGLSRSGADAFWFPDYLGDLDALLTHFSPSEPVRLVGHSMGGNIACTYAGVRPARVAAVVALDAFGLPDRQPQDAPGRLEKWLNQLAQPDGFRAYVDTDAFAARLMRDNPRLAPDKARFLATRLTRSDDQGGVRVSIDDAHRHVNPVLYRRAEAEHCWRRAKARVCWIVQADPVWRRKLGVPDEVYAAATACFAHFREVAIAESGHNLHHDQPERVAAVIEDFMLECLPDV